MGFGLLFIFQVFFEPPGNSSNLDVLSSHEKGCLDATHSAPN